ncbi:DUF2321 domain-containing protein [Nucisporomicrobium flavum]|uniref:DUF2321 domain-containing protein n=1 Tax=Nucisporomicrobium flavum TaxID=2785915 RepID=UPI0018F3E9E5|nr:DUF2321 domain-containing protein [Nucisporomicrobium flavum]
MIRFPEADLERYRRKPDRFHHAAAVCRRGHEQTTTLSPSDLYPDDTKCPKCGARVLLGCTSCGLRIRGKFHIEPYMADKHSLDPEWERPTFCDGCGAAHPWATREERIFELENILDEEQIDEADRVFLHDRLAELRALDDVDDKRERQIWAQIKQRGGSFLTSAPVMQIVQNLITAKIRHDLGI